MKIPDTLRASALAAFRNGVTWAAFMAKYHDTIRQVEKYDHAKYHRLRDAVRSIVVSGTISGLLGCGDPDACTWFEDDADQADQPDDTTTNARSRGPLPITQTTAFDTSDQYR